jgi:hyperosmotically inducible protein
VEAATGCERPVGIASDGADHSDEENLMNRKWMFAALLFTVFSPLASGQAQPSNAAAQPANPAQLHIQREVRHELLMLPYFGVFDNIAFQVQGSTVTLMGDVTRPTLKSDAGNSVKHIEGVTQVVNNINVLPPSPMDDRTRLALFHAIYGFPSLEKYALGVQKPIRIIVSSGHVTLTGVVDSDADKNTAGIRANSVPGIFSVANNLQVVPQ